MRENRKGDRKLIRVTRGVEELEMRLLLSTSVTTYHNDNSGTGQNLNETILTPANVNVSTFGKQFSTPVDGQVYAQPLYVSGVNIPAGRFAGVHDVAYVATQHDSLYAIDAHGGNVLWHLSFLDPATPGAALPGATAINTFPNANINFIDFEPEIGITGTPVIDPAQHALFAVAETRQIVDGQTHYVAGLFKVDIQSGTVIASKVIADTIDSGGVYTYRTAASPTADQDPFVVGTGGGAITVNGQQRIYFNAKWQTSRPGIVLHDGHVYTGWASKVAGAPYHGWFLGFDENTLATTAVFNTTPRGSGGGIWQGGGITAIDSSGNFYFQTGYGTFDGKNDGSGRTIGLDANGFPVNGNYGNAFVKLALDGGSDAGSQNGNGWGVKLVDYFAHRVPNTYGLPGNAGGVTILPDAVGSSAHPHLLFSADGGGLIYLIDRDNMGKYDCNTDHVVQEQFDPTSGSSVYNSPSLFYDGTTYRLYIAPSNGIKSYTIADGALSTNYTSRARDTTAGFSGGTSVSANGSSNGIVWQLDGGSNQLRAYDATDLAKEPWTSGQARDTVGTMPWFGVPTIADGEVFVGTTNALVIYGRPVAPTAGPAAPTELTATARNDRVVNLAWLDNSNDEDYFSILRSSDGVNFSEVGRAGGNFQTYADSNNLVPETRYYYQVVAHNSFGGGAVSPPSNTAQATTRKPPPIGNGDGAAASYFKDFNGQHLISPAALTRVDPQINFVWTASGPGAPIGTEFFSVRWTGRIRAQYSELYTFYTESDDGVRLYIKPTTSSTYTTLVDDWTLHRPAEDAGTFMMSAGQSYDFKMEYFQNSGETTAQLLWSSPSTVKAIIPQSQLYSGVTPAAPSSVIASGGSGKVSLSWAATPGAERYSVYRSTTPGGQGAAPLATDITDPNYVDTTATAGATYYYKVTATNDGGESAASTEQSVYSHIPADANDDRSVDFNDLVALAQNYNTSGKTFAQGDFTGDGSVDFNDLVVLAQHYNMTFPAAAPGETTLAIPIAGAAPMPSLATVMDQLNENPTPKPAKARPAPAVPRRPVAKAAVTTLPPPVANPFSLKQIASIKKRSDLFA